MKEYQNLIGRIIIAAAIVIVGILVANALEHLGGQVLLQNFHYCRPDQ